MFAVQKVVLHGNSARVTLPRPLMYFMNIRPGHFVEFVTQPDGTVIFRPWRADDNATTTSPGVITPPPVLTK